MFVINEDKSIYLTRGDTAFFTVSAQTETGEAYKFLPGDVVRFKVFQKKFCEKVFLSKDFGVEVETEEVEIYLEEKDTKIGKVINKPTDYWYEIELNPYTNPQTIIGYDDDGAKIFKLFPEGNEAEDNEPITPEDIPVVDKELDLTSTRPVQNQAIARAILKINEDVNASLTEHSAEISKTIEEQNEAFDETMAEQKRVFNEALAGIVAVDISDDFFESEGDFVWEGNVYKQGEVIYGYVIGAGETTTPTLFSIKKEYSGDFISANAFLVTTLSANAEAIPMTVMATGSPADVTVMVYDGSILPDNTSLKGMIYLDFTYICK